MISAGRAGFVRRIGMARGMIANSISAMRRMMDGVVGVVIGGIVPLMHSHRILLRRRRGGTIPPRRSAHGERQCETDGDNPPNQPTHRIRIAGGNGRRQHRLRRARC